MVGELKQLIKDYTEKCNEIQKLWEIEQSASKRSRKLSDEMEALRTVIKKHLVTHGSTGLPTYIRIDDDIYIISDGYIEKITIVDME